jgi:hypothetical protein
VLLSEGGDGGAHAINFIGQLQEFQPSPTSYYAGGGGGGGNLSPGGTQVGGRVVEAVEVPESPGTANTGGGGGGGT